MLVGDRCTASSIYGPQMDGSCAFVANNPPRYLLINPSAAHERHPPRFVDLFLELHGRAVVVELHVSGRHVVAATTRVWLKSAFSQFPLFLAHFLQERNDTQPINVCISRASQARAQWKARSCPRPSTTAFRRLPGRTAGLHQC